MTINLLMIGLNPNIVKSLERSSKKINLYVIEENELWATTNLDSPIIKEVRFGEYQQSLKCVDVAVNWSKDIVFNAVMSGREYGVLATNEIAKHLSLRNLGKKASLAVTHKTRLREALKDSGINQPHYMKINSVNDLYNFHDRYGNEPFILKPANRQSSVGVVRINNKEEIHKKWNEVLNSSEGNNVVTRRELSWDYQAEQLIEGYEVSVETFISNGKILLNNITKKITRPDNYFVELGHILPANLLKNDEELLLKSQKRLVQNLKIENGLIHSEWIISKGQPFLIECAGRAPGGSIPDLFRLSYEVEMFDLYLSILLEPIDILQIKPKSVSLLGHLTPLPGQVKEVKGLEIARNLKGFVDFKLLIKEGECVPPLTNNGARVGYFIINSDTQNSVLELEKDIRNNLFIKTLH